MTAMAREMAEQPALTAALLERRHELAARVGAIAPRPLAGVILIARGSSDNAAVYGRYVLEAALRRPVSLAAPSLWTRYGLEEDLRGHLAVGVSQSGRTPEIADTLARVRDAGAATVAVTNDAASPLAAAAHATIDLQVGREDAVPATKTVTAQLAAFAILADALGDAPWPDARVGGGAARAAGAARPTTRRPPRPAPRSPARAATSSSAAASSTRSPSRARSRSPRPRASPPPASRSPTSSTARSRSPTPARSRSPTSPPAP